MPGAMESHGRQELPVPCLIISPIGRWRLRAEAEEAERSDRRTFVRAHVTCTINGDNAR